MGPLLSGTVFHLFSSVLVLQSHLRGLFLSLEQEIEKKNVALKFFLSTAVFQLPKSRGLSFSTSEGTVEAAGIRLVFLAFVITPGVMGKFILSFSSLQMCSFALTLSLSHPGLKLLSHTQFHLKPIICALGICGFKSNGGLGVLFRSWFAEAFDGSFSFLSRQRICVLRF